MENEWGNEPDRKEFTHAGFECRIIRNRLGALCGYVGVDESHKMYGKNYDDIRYIDVHGGLTFAGHLSDEDKLWWLGFDCSHAGDLLPIHEDTHDNEYRNIGYVTGQVHFLAGDLKRICR